MGARRRLVPVARVAASAFLYLACGGAFAQTPDEMMQRAMNNLAHEYAECSAYFSIVAVAGENSGDNELRDSYNSVATMALEYALLVGEDVGLLEEAHAARVEIAIEAMAKRINNDTKNISILFRDYGTACQTAMEDIAGRVDYWVDREIAKVDGQQQ